MVLAALGVSFVIVIIIMAINFFINKKITKADLINSLILWLIMSAVVFLAMLSVSLLFGRVLRWY